MRLTTCISCQAGHHAGHQRVVQRVPEGMLGGAVCTCNGECEGKPSGPFAAQVRKINRAMRKARAYNTRQA
jgi:hypothetical protein